jgi:hypothetical protein
LAHGSTGSLLSVRATEPTYREEWIDFSSIHVLTITFSGCRRLSIRWYDTNCLVLSLLTRNSRLLIIGRIINNQRDEQILEGSVRLQFPSYLRFLQAEDFTSEYGNENVNIVTIWDHPHFRTSHSRWSPDWNGHARFLSIWISKYSADIALEGPLLVIRSNLSVLDQKLVLGGELTHSTLASHLNSMVRRWYSAMFYELDLPNSLDIKGISA